MATRVALFRRIIWPARGGLFAIIGSATGLFGDMVGFFTEFFSPTVLMVLFAGLALVAALLCFQRALMVDPSNDEAVSAVVDCQVCDAFRFGLFATGAFMLLMLVGQGQSATEMVGRRLGLIEADVTEIRDNVRDLHEGAQAAMVIRNPRTPAELFSNAWVYTHVRRDTDQAWKTLGKLYDDEAPRMMDAADLYVTVGRTVLGPAPLQAELVRLGRAKRDATLLVLAARNAATEAEADSLLAEARGLDPALPFAHWDPLVTRVRVRPNPDPMAQVRMLEARKAAIETFIREYSAHPPGRWFFMPQYQGDYLTMARSLVDSLTTQIDTFRKIAAGNPGRVR
ncbi:hypothetical protein [Parapedomonas caeni]